MLLHDTIHSLSYYLVMQECRGGLADLVFVVDSSGSIDRTKDWPLALRFLTSVVDRVDAGGTFRVGMVVYSSSSRNRFFLNTYTSRNDIKSAITGTKYIGGRTNTAGALRTARTEQFVPAKGDRVAAPNVVIVLTDGSSNDRSR